MAQTEFDYNDLMFGTRDHNFRHDSVTITSGAGDLAAGTVVVLDPSALTYGVWDTETTTIDTTDLDTTPVVGVGVLLEAADAESAEATARVGFTGGVFSDKLVLAGSTVTAVNAFVEAVLRANGIEVLNGTSSIYVAGE